MRPPVKVEADDNAVTACKGVKSLTRVKIILWSWWFGAGI